MNKDASDPAAERVRLRHQAEEQVKAQLGRFASHTTEADAKKLLAELTVHQAELEIQNEELRRAREEAETVHERYTELFDFAPVGYFTLDREGTIEQLNLAGAGFLGLERSRVVKRRLATWINNDTRPRYSAFLHDVFDSDEQLTCEVSLAPAKGTGTVVEIAARREGNSDSCRAVMTDITERRRTAEAQQLTIDILHLLNHSSDLPGMLGRLLQLLIQARGLDAAALRLRNNNDFPYYAQQGFSEEFIRQEDSLCASAENRTLLRDEAGLPVLECTCGLVLSGRADPALPFFTPQGSFFCNETSALLELKNTDDPRTHPRNRCIHEGYKSVALVPLRVDEEIVGLLQLNALRAGAFSDNSIAFFESISESIGMVLTRQTAEEKFRHAEKLAAVGQLAGGIAHEYNNLLTSILAYADMLTSTLQDEKHRRYASHILTASRRAADLTAQILTVARKDTVALLPVDIHSIIAEVIELMQHSLDKRIVVKQHFEALHTRVLADKTQLHTMLINLALNARDAMPGGGILTIATGTITLDAAFCRQALAEPVPGQYAWIAISDTGCGIDFFVRKRLFEPFFTTKEVGSGTGLGLAAVYGGIQMHKGTIAVESVPGAGSTFTLYLPLAEEAEPYTEHAPAETACCATGTVLVVDDEALLRELATDILTGIGCTVLTAANGKEAIALYQSSWQTIDLVILDLTMPDLNGYQTFAAMQQVNPAVKAVLSSGHAVAEEIPKGLLGFVQKPYSCHVMTGLAAGLLPKMQ